ncbi:MAG: hypothetical protein N7Q72_03085, partial [Spiroplasma sp. Tabriz.8]|nr:hypothetical protein [Spiroplasma sp. Tabriz.8]
MTKVFKNLFLKKRERERERERESSNNRHLIFPKFQQPSPSIYKVLHNFLESSISHYIHFFL